MYSVWKGFCMHDLTNHKTNLGLARRTHLFLTELNMIRVFCYENEQHFQTSNDRYREIVTTSQEQSLLKRAANHVRVTWMLIALCYCSITSIPQSNVLPTSAVNPISSSPLVILMFLNSFTTPTPGRLTSFKIS